MQKFESAYRIGKGYFVEEDIEEVASDETLETDLEEAVSDSEMADVAEPHEEPSEPEITEPDTEMNDNVDVAQSEVDDQLESDFDLEEVPLERPRVSLRKRLQFES